MQVAYLSNHIKANDVGILHPQAICLLILLMLVISAFIRNDLIEYIIEGGHG